jgi:hypothetical protein
MEQNYNHQNEQINHHMNLLSYHQVLVAQQCMEHEEMASDYDICISPYLTTILHQTP